MCKEISSSTGVNTFKGSLLTARILALVLSFGIFPALLAIRDESRISTAGVNRARLFESLLHPEPFSLRSFGVINNDKRSDDPQKYD